MSNFISIEYVAANAIVELLQYGEEGRISFEKLTEYGLIVSEVLSTKIGERAFFILDKDVFYNFYTDYSDYFIISEEDGRMYLKKREAITIEQLKERFIFSISYNTYKALTSKEGLNVLGVV